LAPNLFGRDYFLYVDFDGYSGCNHRSLNSFFSSLVCVLDIDSIAQSEAILFSLIMNTVRDCGYIWIAQHYFRQPTVLFFALLLAGHPYLGLYHAKLATSCFAAFGVFIFCLGHLLKSRPWYFDLLQIALTGFRNGLAVLYISDYLFNLVAGIKTLLDGEATAKPKTILKSIGAPLICIALILTVINIPDQNYMNTVTNSLAHYTLNAEYFVNRLDLPDDIIGTGIGYGFLILTNLVLLTGFREAAFTGFPDYFLSFDTVTMLSIFSGILLTAFHLFGLVYYVKWCARRCPRLILVFVLVIPNLLFVAHMRYLLPIMPLAILGVCHFLETRIFVAKPNMKSSDRPNH